MQVSYPQYLRLVALQEKVVKLDKLIKALQARYTLEELEQLPQYARLQTLHQSLLPLLPNNGQLPEEEEEEEVMVDKRSPFSVDFMGMQVSYPQYLRLVALQEKVVQLDKLLKKMRQFKTEEELAKIPQWQRYFNFSCFDQNIISHIFCFLTKKDFYSSTFLNDSFKFSSTIK